MLKKLCNIQNELKAPKNQYNSFGKYKYRNAEDILEAVKPLLKAEGCTLVLSDEVALIGNRYYIKATATIRDIETGVPISVDAYAREDESKKGMDGSQVSGAASSYARKYALNGLFCIDDTKDADTDEHYKTIKKPASKPKTSGEKVKLKAELLNLIIKKEKTVEDVLKIAKVSDLDELTEGRMQGCIDWLKKQ